MLLLGVAGSLGAYDLAELDGDGNPGNAPILLGWENHRFPLPVSIDPAPPQGLTDFEYRDATLAAFFAWQDVGAGDLAFQEFSLPASEFTTDKLTASLVAADCAVASECRHLVTALSSNWTALSGSDMGVIALTVVKFNTDTRRILDYDIMLDDEFHDFATNGDATKYDLEGIMAHEVGHALGVAHPANADRATSTMWGVTPLGNTSLRTLEEDDATAARYLYSPLNIPVRPPDNNLFGLIERAGGTMGGDGGCDLGGGTQGIAFAGLWLGLVGLAIRPRPRRPSPGDRRRPPPPGRP
jgi:hypothetical protein